MSRSQRSIEDMKREHWGEKINDNDSETVRCSQKKNCRLAACVWEDFIRNKYEYKLTN